MTDFGILGPLEVRRDGVVVDVPGTRQRALLAVLLLRAGEVVPAERLLEDVWSDDPPTAGNAALRVRISQLRKALGPDGGKIVTRAPGYVLAVEPGQVDLQRFEQLLRRGGDALARDDAAVAAPLFEEALGLWRGSALADFPYEPFAQGAIRRLEELRLVAREQLVAAQLAQGRHAMLLGELRELVAEHPMRERLWAHLMLALYRDGRQAEALEAYRDARRALVDEVGIEPGPELQELERRILAQDPSLTGGVRTERPPRVVLALADAEASVAPLATMGTGLAREAGAELIVGAIVADEVALGAIAPRLQEVRDGVAGDGPAVRVAAFTSDDPGRDAARLAADHDVALLLVEAAGAVLDDGRFGPALETILREAASDVAVVVGPARDGQDAAAPVVVPFAGHEHDWAALEAGAWLAKGRGGGLRLVGTRAAPLAGRRDASRLLASASIALQRGVGVATDVVLADAGPEGILEAAAGGGVLVTGLSPRWAKEGLGTSRRALARGAACPVLVVRRGVSPGGLAPPEAMTRFTWSRAGG